MASELFLSISYGIQMQLILGTIHHFSTAPSKKILVLLCLLPPSLSLPRFQPGSQKTR